METYYKCLDAGGVAPFSGFAWPLPTRRPDGSWEPGAWVRVRSRLEPCVRGLHACTIGQLPRWLSDDLYYLEYKPGTKVLTYRETCIGTTARLTAPVETWVPATMRLFACDCAERAVTALASEPAPLLAALGVARRYADDAAGAADLAAARHLANAVAADERRRPAQDAARAVAGCCEDHIGVAAPWWRARHAVVYSAARDDEEIAWQVARLAAYLGPPRS